MIQFDIIGLDIKKQLVVNNLVEFARLYSLNTGNLVFHYGLNRILDSEFSKVYSWTTNNDLMNKNSKGVIIPMANQIGQHIDLSLRGPKVNQLEIPLVLIGLGAQFKSLSNPNLSLIPNGTIQWIKEVSSLGKKNIGVRGEYTFNILKRLGLSDSVVPLGCQSNFINMNENLGQEIMNKFINTQKDEYQNNIAITAGAPDKKEYTTLEQSFLKLTTSHNAKYIVQAPSSLLALSLGWKKLISEMELEQVKTSWFPSYSYEEIFSWFYRYSKVYVSVSQWIMDLSKEKIVFGTRIHGVQAALQAGTPAICFCIDSRTKELCEFMKIPHVMARDYKEGVTLDICLKIFSNWDYKAYDERRLFLANKMKDFLESNNIKISNDFLKFCNKYSLKQKFIPSNKKVIIHIGMHKTGTTSIQESLKYGLKNDDYYFLDLGHSNHSIPIYSLFCDDPINYYIHKFKNLTIKQIESYNNANKDLLMKELKNNKTKNIIISGEDINKLSIEGLRKLKSFINNSYEDIHIIGYVREVSSYMQSMFQQKVKGGGLKDFDIEGTYPYYKNTFEKFDIVFGKENVNLWKFEPKDFYKNNIVLDFCNHLGIKFDESKIVYANESLSEEALRILYIFRKYGPTLGNENYPLFKNEILLNLISGIGTNKFEFSYLLVKKILDVHKSDIEWMENRINAKLINKNLENGIKSELDLLNISEELSSVVLKLYNINYKNKFLVKEDIVDIITTILEMKA